MNNKMTKSETFATIKANYPTTAPNYAEVIALCEKSIEQLANKKATANKDTEKNNEIRAEILEQMEKGRAYTITEMLTEIPACYGMQNQRASALVRGLLGNGIERTEKKGRAYFTKVID